MIIYTAFKINIFRDTKRSLVVIVTGLTDYQKEIVSAKGFTNYESTDEDTRESSDVSESCECYSSCHKKLCNAGKILGLVLI